MMRKTGGLIVLIATCLAAGGCGYSTGSVYETGVRSVYVEFFDNRTFRRGLEVDLTEAIVSQIKMRTPLIIAPRSEADSILSGELLDFEEKTLIEDKDDRLLLEDVTATVRFRWYDRLTKADIVPPGTVAERARVSLDERLTDLPLRELAERIVDQMQENW